MHAATLSTLAVISLAFTACASRDDAATDPAASALVDQTSADVTVLRAEVREPLGGNGEPGFTDAQCTNVDVSTNDCTSAMEARFSRPPLHTILVNKHDFFCNTLHVVTVTREAALAQAEGIGFYYRGHGDAEGRFVKATELSEIGKVTLESGDTGVLHEFVALANCNEGSSYASSIKKYEFKPYLQFAGSGGPYRNWDASGNYVVRQGAPRFDRSSDLVR